MTTGDMAQLPDGSGFFIGSLPLPKDHWIYQPTTERAYGRLHDTFVEYAEIAPPHFIQNLGESDLNSLRERLRENLRDAIRDATLNGTEMDFDPDALMQSFMHRVFSQTSIWSRCHVIEDPANGAD